MNYSLALNPRILFLQVEFNRLVNHFVTYDDQFEYGARLPSWCIKEWSAAKKYLLNLFGGIASDVLKNQKKAEEQVSFT